jgi:hypothetical protein
LILHTLIGQKACLCGSLMDIVGMSVSYTIGTGRLDMKGQVFVEGIIILTTIPISKR